MLIKQQKDMQSLAALDWKTLVALKMNLNLFREINVCLREWRMLKSCYKECIISQI